MIAQPKGGADLTATSLQSLSDIKPDAFGQVILEFNAGPEYGAKRVRNMVRNLLKNPNVSKLIRIGSDTIIALPECKRWLIQAQLSLLAHRRDDEQALSFCNAILKQAREHDIERSVTLLKAQTLIRLNQWAEAETLIDQSMAAQEPTEGELTLLSWRASRMGDQHKSRALFRRSSAKHIQTLRKSPGTVEKVNNVAPLPGHVKIYLTTNNEMELLPELLNYYRRLGKVQFVIVDNQSKDGTLEFLKDQNDVVLYYTEESFGEAVFGCTWLNAVVPETSTATELCIRVDADEFLVYSGMDNTSLNDFLEAPCRAGIDIVPAILIDMYPEDVAYSAETAREGENEGQRTLREAVFFDASIETRGDFAPPYQHHSGGVRPRLFNGRTYLTKSPIFRGGGVIKYLNANHTTTPGKVASFNCNLLHYKFTPQSIARYKTQIERGEHYENGARYRKFISLIQNRTQSMLSEQSIRYKTPRTLEQLGYLIPPQDDMLSNNQAE